MPSHVEMFQEWKGWAKHEAVQGSVTFGLRLELDSNPGSALTHYVTSSKGLNLWDL